MMEDKRALYASINDPVPRKPRLRGSQFLDTTQQTLTDAWQGAREVEDWRNPRDVLAAGTARTIEGGLKGLGAVASIPGIKQVLEWSDKPADWASKKGGEYLQSQGIDPRYAELAIRGADLALGGGLAKGGAKLAKAGLKRGARKAGTSWQLLTGGGPGTGSGWAAGAAVKRLAPDAEGIWNVTKKQLPQLKKQFGEWAQEQYKVKGSAKKVKRKEFGTIIVDGDAREVQGLTEFLERGGKLPDMPKVATRTQARFRRLQREKPPVKELNALGKSYGLSMDDMKEYYQNAVAGFASVREASKRHSKFRGEFHAGHYYPAARGGPTSGRSAGIELGVENIRKKDHFDGTINLYAAQRAGIPTTWAEDFKMWFRDKKGLPGPSYVSDFTNKQREIIESIPWTASEKEVNAIFKKFKLPGKSKKILKKLLDEI